MGSSTEEPKLLLFTQTSTKHQVPAGHRPGAGEGSDSTPVLRWQGAGWDDGHMKSHTTVHVGSVSQEQEG